MSHFDPHFSIPDQVRELLGKGLPESNREAIERALGSVPYCHLKPYWIPLLNHQNRSEFQPSVTFDQIWRRYTFDRQLRLLVLDAIERVEVALRRHMSDVFGPAYGATGYLNDINFDLGFDTGKLQELREKIGHEWSRSRGDIVEEYRAKYPNSSDPPLWFAFEVMSFGSVVTFFRSMKKREKNFICRELGIVDPKVLESWLVSLLNIRNVCAHQGRLWNRPLSYQVKIPKQVHDSTWYSPDPPENRRIYAILLILKWLLGKLAPQSKWRHRFDRLLLEYPDIPLKQMGFPTNWEESPIWKNTNSP